MEPDGDGDCDLVGVAVGDVVPLCVGVGLHTIFCARIATPGHAPPVEPHATPPVGLVHAPTGVPNPATGSPPLPTLSQFAESPPVE